MIVNNFKVKWAHETPIVPNSYKLSDDFKSHKYGSTTCELYLNDKLLSCEIAKCHPKDQFNKAMGRYISFKKTMNINHSELTKSERTQLWIAFNQSINYTKLKKNKQI